MTRGGFTPLRLLLAAVLATVAVCGGCMPKGVRLADLRAALPDASTVRLYDRPSDDGSAIILEWGKVDDVVEGVSYVVEIAKSDDFKAGQFKTITVEPSDNLLKSSREKYFGFAESNRDCYALEMTPAEQFKPKMPWEMSAKEAAALKRTATRVARSAREEVVADLAYRHWLAWCVQDGLLSETDARRAAEARPLSVAFEADVATATAKAEGARKVAEKQLARAVAAREAAEAAAEKATGAAAEKAQQTLTETVAAEVEAKIAMRDATDAVRLGAEEVRSRLTASRQKDLDWFGRLEAHLSEVKEARLKAAQQEVNGWTYYYRLGVTDGKRTIYVGPPKAPDVYRGRAVANLFRWYKLNNLVFCALFLGCVSVFIQVARRNPNLFIRKIPGLEAVEEAIGRATEMGRPAFFVHGLGNMGALATIAAINVLGRVARRAANYDTRVRVMNCDPIVTAISQEVVQQAYTEAGRPDAYDADDVALVAYSQFSYAAAVSGRMMREKPAAIFLMGGFMAESLLLAETGAATGAIQIAGTDSDSQLPFFITTCDYTLIGEELYAASAYLSREPRMLGSLRGQDLGKAFLMGMIVVGSAFLTVAGAIGLHTEWFEGLFKVLH